MKPHDNDPDETEGRRIYRAIADNSARAALAFGMNIKRVRVLRGART